MVDAKVDEVFMGQFESIGENCEFGFVLQNCGIDDGTFLRWALVPSARQLVRLLQADFNQHLIYTNIVPLHETMILDRAFGVGWHSPIVAKLREGSQHRNPDDFVFVTPEERRRTIIAQEKEKLLYLFNKTMTHIKKGSRIFVYKPFNGILSVEDCFMIQDALSRLGSGRMLVVTKEDSHNRRGNLNVLRKDLLHGIVDRFAPGSRAREVSLESWTSICRKTAEYFSSPPNNERES